jgi:hypothetical protein
MISGLLLVLQIFSLVAFMVTGEDKHYIVVFICMIGVLLL